MPSDCPTDAASLSSPVSANLTQTHLTNDSAVGKADLPEESPITSPAADTPHKATLNAQTTAAAADPPVSEQPTSRAVEVLPSTSPTLSPATPDCKLTVAGKQSESGGLDPGSVSGKGAEPVQGRRKQAATGAGIGSGAPGRGQAKGSEAGGHAAGRARHGVQLSFAEQLYAWCREVRACMFANRMCEVVR